MVNLAFITDDKFFLPTIVAIHSLIENKKEETTYSIYCLTLDVQKENLALLKEMEVPGVKIVLVEIDKQEFRKKFDFINEHICAANTTALLKFELPNVLGEVEKVLYLDGDIIVRDDLESIFSTELEGNTIAAVKDSGVLYIKDAVGIANDDYFNSGVMLLDLKAMRAQNASKKLIEAKMDCSDNTLMDQNIFNIVFTKKVKLLPIEYNVMYSNLVRADMRHGINVHRFNEVFEREYCNWEELLENAVVVHYAFMDKPWKFDDATGVALWDSYFRSSPANSKNLKRKHIYMKQVNCLRKAGFGLIGDFWWSYRIRGLKKTIKETARFILEKIC